MTVNSKAFQEKLQGLYQELVKLKTVTREYGIKECINTLESYALAYGEHSDQRRLYNHAAQLLKALL